jgi:peptide/nickel transport system permease protein
MHRYIIRRVLLFIPTVFILMILVFFMLRVIPGNIAELILAPEAGDLTREELEEAIAELEKFLGIDKPLHVQFFVWMKGWVTLDLGQSYASQQPVSDELMRRWPITVELMLLTFFFTTIFALPIGVLAALYQDRWPDYVLRVIALIGLSIPTFWLGTLVILAMVLWFNYLPPLGMVQIWDDPWKNLQQIFWPALVAGFHGASTAARMARSATLEVLREDYVRTARAKGLKEKTVIMRHVIKNAMIPVVTLLGFTLVFLMGGSVIIETVFSVPGIGRLLVGAIQSRDYPITQSVTFIFVFMVLFINLLVDLFYSYLNPRIRYS